MNTFHVNSQVASLYASIAAVGTLKWLFAGMNKLVVLYFAVFYRLAAKVADYLSEPAQSQYSTIVLYININPRKAGEGGDNIFYFKYEIGLQDHEPS